ncbi:MAG: hypothetical protein PHW39_08400 [Syntrophomonadaceae bacterium]|nr:hypothetical protein [Syntrophomonadaceae bacterium]
MSISKWLILLLILGILYEKIWRPIICKRKIREHIEVLGGEVWSIEKISMREEIYNVKYKINGELKNAVVKFSLFYGEKWRQ